MNKLFPQSFKTLVVVSILFATLSSALLAQDSKENPMEINLESIGIWCNQQNIRFQRDDANGRITLNQIGKLNLAVTFVVDQKTRMLSVVVPVPLKKTTVNREVLVRASNRLNLGISLGSFVSHPKGYVYYRAAVPTKGFWASPSGIDYLFRLAIGSVEGIQKKFQSVATGNTPPEKIL